MFKHKGTTLYTIKEASNLVDVSEGTIKGLIVSKKLESLALFGTTFVTEQGISELLAKYGVNYDNQVAQQILHKSPKPSRPVDDTIEYEGETLHSVAHASRKTGYARKSIRQYLTSGIIEGRKILGFWYLTDTGMETLLKRKAEFRPEPVIKPKRKKAAKGMKVEFNTPAGRAVMKYVRQLSEKLGMTYKDTAITLMEMALSDTDKISHMIRVAEYNKMLKEDKMQAFNIMLSGTSYESPVLLCSND